MNKQAYAHRVFHWMSTHWPATKSNQPRQTWRAYEHDKALLCAQDLPSDEYERELKEIAQRYGI